MRLVNLNTNLKSLRYGNDRLGAGMSEGSGQPYIKSPIPVGRIPNGLGDEDFLLRGGSLAPGRIARDVSRITKMFFDLKSPNGLLFTAKQNLLSRSGVNIFGTVKTKNLPLNNGIYLPTSTILQTGVNGLGGHLIKQGINPFQVTNTIANGNITSTGQNLGSGGSTLPLNNPLYIDSVAQNERQNPFDEPTSRLLSFTKAYIDTNQGDQSILYKYSGGPGSTLGVGETIIPFRQRTGLNNPLLAGQFTGQFISGSVNGSFDYSAFRRPSVNFSGSNIFNRSISKTYQQITGIDIIEGQYKTTNASGPLRDFVNNVFQTGSFQPSSTVRGLNTTFNYNQLQNAFNDNSSSISQVITSSGANLSDGGPNNVYANQEIREDFRRKTPSSSSLSKNYNVYEDRLEGRVNLGNPARAANRTSYVNGATDATGKSLGALDKLNVVPLYQSQNVKHEFDINDLVKFRIAVINNNNPSLKTYIHFRAFLDTFSDAYSAEWKGERYPGRAEELYAYQGFGRSIDLAWTVVAQSKAELMPMYRKLNYLASVCGPDYSDDGYMRGNLVELTVGGWCYNQPGFIKGMTLDVPDQSPWEIGIVDSPNPNVTSQGGDKTVKEMPLIVKVSGFQFVPIHNFVPSIQKNLYDDLGVVSQYGEQRYLALNNNVSNNYDNLYYNNQ